MCFIGTETAVIARAQAAVKAPLQVRPVAAHLTQ